MRERSAAVWAAIVAVVGLDELLLLVALALVAIGFWLAWKPGAFLAPGLVLLWLTIPSRSSFLVKPPAPDEKAGRKR